MWPDEWYRKMGAVHTTVNALPYVGDAQRYRREDFWTSIDAAGAGDCEDYAIAKLRRLTGLGWPVAALHLACCWTETQEYHAVLIAEGPDGNAYLLDNRLQIPVDVGELQALHYRPDVIQEQGGKPAWREWKFSEPKER